jgi:cellulose synthase/poly-beta-1,6-N-acetylglucosamine synthase-like glycosyltransferase
LLPELIFAVIVLGVNFTFWGVMGVLRYAEEALIRRSGTKTDRTPEFAANREQQRDGSGDLVGARLSVAVLIPAHNEEAVLDKSLAAITRIVGNENVFVVSDASTDRTLEIARRWQVHSVETIENVGKAGALETGIREFSLISRYEVVLILDADTYICDNYLDAALPLFDDPRTVAVAGCALTEWSPPGVSLLGKLLISHRGRIYGLTQRLIKLGQTWHRTNALYIVPGFASLYRTRILPMVDINPPGLVIEDFNMTFEIYRKQLGHAGFTLGACAITQDPHRLADYVRQTKRWTLGFWQAVRRHSFRRYRLFEAMLTMLVLELVVSSILLLLLPVIVTLPALAILFPGLLNVPEISSVLYLYNTYVDPRLVLLAVLIPDYLLTLAVAIGERRPRYLLFAPFFILLRILDAAIALYALPRAWAEQSTGRWTSPTRRRAAGPTSAGQLAARPIPVLLPIDRSTHSNERRVG